MPRIFTIERNKVMGVLKYGLTLCFVLVTYYYLRRIFEESKPLVFDGYYHPDFKGVADVFRQVYVIHIVRGIVAGRRDLVYQARFKLGGLCLRWWYCCFWHIYLKIIFFPSVPSTTAQNMLIVRIYC